MSKPLRVLIVEDSEDDVALLLRELRGGGFDPVHVRVEDAAALRAALRDDSWEIVLSDHIMPRFDSFMALEIVREQRSDIPFIVVSGTVGEDVAVEVMKSGADDYLLKDSLIRLVPAIMRELEEAESRRQRRRAEDALHISEARFRAIVEDQTEFIARSLPHVHTLTFVNQAYCRCFGKTREELIGTRFMDHVPEAERAAIDEQLATLGPENPVVQVEHSAIAADGETRWHQWTDRAIFDDDGNITEIQAVGRDITEMKRAAEAIRLSEEKFSKAFRAGPDSIVITRMSDGTIIDSNDRFLSRIGRDLEDVVGRRVSDVVTWVNPEDRELLVKAIETTGECTDLETDFRYADGRLTNCLVAARAIEVEGERCILTITRDITERKRAEDALRESEERYRLLVDLSPSAVFVHCGGKVVFANNAMVELMGADTFQRLIGMDALDIMHPDTRERIRRLRADIESHGRPVNVEPLRYLRFDGTERTIESNAAPFAWNGEDAFMIVAHDVTERVFAEQALRESEERYRLLIEASPDAILVTDESGIVVFANSTAVDLFGADSVDRLIGVQMLDLVHPEDRADVAARRQQLLHGARPPFAQRRRLRLDGSDFYSESRGIPFTWDGGAAVLIVIRDITERKRTEEQLRQAQKMEAVGQLTGGVAHDFNNLLMVVLGNLEMAKDDLGDDSDVSALVGRASAAAERGATLTHRLLAFSRKQTLMPGIIDLNQLVAGMTDLLRRTLEEIVEIETASADDLWPCEADSSQMENALLNLAINARDAMPDGGKLTIETGNVDLDDDYAAAQVDVSPGQYVMVAVTDTGAGMPRHVIDRAFEPFFTTKKAGHGSGLGLSMIYGFVKQSGGHVTIYSEEGVGTTVKMYLPRSFAEAEEARHEERETEPRARGETILVVEDDPDVRTLTVALLGNLGYEILEAADGDSALAALDQASRVNLLFTDVVLPGGMGGLKLAEEVRRRVPGVSVLFTSGYTDNAIIHQGRLDKDIELLNKPFGKAELARRVRSVLDQADP